MALTLIGLTHDKLLFVSWPRHRPHLHGRASKDLWEVCDLPLMHLFGTCNKRFITKCLPVTPETTYYLRTGTLCFHLGITPDEKPIFPDSHLHTHELVQGPFHKASLGLRAGWRSRFPSNNNLGLRVSLQEWIGQSWLVVQLIPDTDFV